MKAYADMSAAEREEWMEAMTIADRRHDYAKRHVKHPSLRETMLDWQEKRKMRYWS